MRNLTIKRTKCLVACLVKMKIYIEDPASNEIIISNTACRKLGDLKSGEEKTFQIDEHAAKVFVIADELSKGFCNEYYQLPDGQEDIFLSGKNKFNPASGNAFRFDNNENEEIKANRKRNSRKGWVVFIASIVVGVLIGYAVSFALLSNKTAKIKTFSSDGMTITLTDEFKETHSEGYTVVYDSKKVAVFALRENFTLAEGFENISLKKYADSVIQANNYSSAKVKTVDGLTYFEHDFISPETNDTYNFFTYVYKTDDAFWVVQFATLSKNSEAYASKITEWAKSVKFSG